VIADVSHLSDRGFDDVAKTINTPFIATHSDSRKICDNKRNLTDGQFKEIVRRGGVVGLNLFPAFLGGGSVDAVCRHVDHFLSLGGENTIAVGADFDGVARLPNDITGIADMVKLYELLSEYYGETIADRIFFGNAYDFFKTVLTGCKSCNNIIKEKK
jgi:membrane dipeptidase